MQLGVPWGAVGVVQAVQKKHGRLDAVCCLVEQGAPVGYAKQVVRRMIRRWPVQLGGRAMGSR